MKVVFLDRDGVINADKDDYVKTADEFVFLPGALEALARLRRAGYAAVVISNQAGIGRGLIEPDEFERISLKMLQGIEDHGGRISGVYYCLHRKDEGCDCRKPQTGLFHKASSELGFQLNGCYFVGDAQSDMEAGQKAGCTTILVLTGKVRPGDVESWEHKPDYVARDLLGAVEWILGRAKR